MSIQQLSVLMNGIRVGTLIKLKEGNLSFHYEKSWLNTLGARPVSLSLPLTDKTYIGDIVNHFFDNLLPDNPVIRARIQAKFHIKSSQPFDLLANIGRDCVGAIQLIQGDVAEAKQSITAKPLLEKDIAALLKNYRTDPLGMTQHNDFRISIAGAQEKTALLYHHNKWCLPQGTTPTSHIFKLPIGMITHSNIDLSDSCENEWLCLKIAEAFNLPTAKANIAFFEDIKALVVERFDRHYSRDKSWLIRLPQEDMCQALGISPNLKYQSDGGPGITTIMNLLLGSNQPSLDRSLFFRSQILFLLLAGIDGHAKNFSVFIEPNGKYQLTPFYDILSAHPMIAKKKLSMQKIKMAMAFKSESNHYRWSDIHTRHILTTAKLSGFSPTEAEKILSDVLLKIDQVIENTAKQLPKKFPAIISDSIFKGMLETKKRFE